MHVSCRQKRRKYVDHALADQCRKFERNNPSSISEFFNKLSYKWETGTAKQYLESLDEWIQICLICHLAEGYINDKTRTDLNTI